jgi:hypothetical protein
MILEARAASCFSSTFVLKIDGRAIGKFEGRWFSESLDIFLTGRRQLQFEKQSWLSSQFVLKDAGADDVLGQAGRSGVFTSAWDLLLSNGSAKMARAGWFASAYQVQQGDEILAQVDRAGICERGWQVESDDSLPEEDLILIGLVYQIIRQRESRQHSHPPGHAGT